MRRVILSNFLTVKDSPFPKALGEWEAGEGSKSIVVGKLPMLISRGFQRRSKVHKYVGLFEEKTKVTTS